MGRKLMLTKQRYPSESKAAQLHEGRFITLKNNVHPRTSNQEFYLQALQENDITICVGPSGCGKTWLVTYIALQQLLSNEVQKIIVTKPILEAGDEQIGLLPGEVDLKIAPHFQSILDCFEDHIGPVMTKNLLDREKIVFLPVAYARGRSLSNSFILVDESQNLTRKGIKLLMTRISAGSQMAINGDTDQCDLPPNKDSGLEWAVNCLRGKHPSIGIVEMRNSDIQRHDLIDVILSNLR